MIGLLRWFLVARWNAPTITSTIDATGRCSLFLFSIAFTASSIHRFYPPFLSIVLDTMDTPEQALDWPQLCSITFHPPCTDSQDFTSLCFPEPFLSEQSMGQWVFGGVGYLFVFLMAITSTDKSQRWLGMTHWRRLHVIGSYWLWTVFLLTYIKHAKEGGEWFFVPLLIFTTALLPIRLAKNLLLKPSLQSA